jgi:peptidoglycan/xylan/chitin deacetylase (PgdA/CDA1 family)
MLVVTVHPRLRRLLALVASAVLLAGVARWGAAVTARDLAAATEPQAVRSLRTTQREVALTFNVSWGHQVPAAVLDALARYGARATFFVAGPWARSNPDLLRRMVADGHTVGTLGFRQMDVGRYPAAVVREEIQRGGDAVREVTGRPPRLWRPPTGEPDAAVLREAAALGYATVLWNLDSNDWSRPGVDYLVARVVRRVSPGSIVLLHADDSLPDTPRALPGIVEGLRKQGYRLVTLARLAGVD